MIVFILYRNICRSPCAGDSRQTGIVAGIVVGAVLHDKLFYHHISRYAQGVAVTIHLEVLVVAVEAGGSQRVDAVRPGVVLDGALIGLDVDVHVTAGRSIYVYII